MLQKYTNHANQLGHVKDVTNQSGHCGLFFGHPVRITAIFTPLRRSYVIVAVCLSVCLSVCE